MALPSLVLTTNPTHAPILRRSTRMLDAGDNPHCQHRQYRSAGPAAILYRAKPLRSLRLVHPSRRSVEDADFLRLELWHAALAGIATNCLQCRTLGLSPVPHLGTLPLVVAVYAGG